MTIKVFDDAVGWVRTHADRFFSTGKPSELELVHWIWLDATLSGCRDVLIHHEGDVWAIVASTDWLRDDVVSAPELFVRMLVQPGGGPNSLRGEVVVNAFCSDVVAIAGGQVVFCKQGNAKPILESVLQRYPGLAAGIAFRV